ncbi:hypothetical protein ACFXPZ_39560 [Streptomyces sp. NPDC059101]|uniref:hypothetical protein n=1 Tax=Streptomyces sp. NPDC059101 TaxID=3346728 RepID=UPI0036CC8BD6
MRDAIARALVWMLRLLLPAQGRHAAPAAPTLEPDTEPTTPPTVRRQWTGPSSTEARAIFRAKEAQTLTPEQRERWWAAAFAEIGVDYDFPTLNITPVRREVAA